MDGFYVLHIFILTVARILQNAGNEPTILKVITVQLILFVPYIVMKMRYCVQKAKIREGVEGNAFAGHEEQIVMAIYVMAGVHPCARREKFWFQEAKTKEDAKDVQHANQTPVHLPDPR